MAKPAGKPRPAAGVTYLEDAAAPGLKFFRCEPYRATLSMKGCGARWAEGQAAVGHGAARYEACRSCPIGAAHAGAEHIHYSKFYGAEICPRCDRGGMRMIGGRICVSCYNREREILAGSNARGNPPIELLQRAPHRIAFRVVHDGRPRLSAAIATDMSEAVVQALRTTRGELAFGFAGPVNTLRQARLF